MLPKIFVIAIILVYGIKGILLYIDITKTDTIEEASENTEKEKDIIMSLDIGVNYIGITILYNDNSQYGQIIELTHVAPRIPNKVKGIEALFMKK